MHVRELLARPQHLPTIPTLVQNLIDSFAQEEVSFGEIARLIAMAQGTGNVFQPLEARPESPVADARYACGRRAHRGA